MSEKKKGKSKKPKRSCGSCPEYVPPLGEQESEDNTESPEVLSSTDEDDRWKANARFAYAELPMDYWNVQKLVKFIKSGNQTASTVALCCLKDYDLTIQINQLAIQDLGGIQVLVNLLECNDAKCQLGALGVLADICLNIDIRRMVVDYGGVPLLLNILNSTDKELKTMASETLANVCKVRLARKYLGRYKGIRKLVDLLDVKLSILQTPREDLGKHDLEVLALVRAAGRALWTCAESDHLKKQMKKTGIIPMISNVLKSVHGDVVTPLLGTLQKCCTTQPEYRIAVYSEGMIADIVNHLHSPMENLKLQGCSVIFKCGSDSATREQVLQAKGVEPLVGIIKDKNCRENKALLAAATGAIWKCAGSTAFVKSLDRLRAIGLLVQFLNEEDDNVLTNVVGAIAECIKVPDNRANLRVSGGLPDLVNLLNLSHTPLLENLAKAFKESAQDLDSMKVLEELDAVRLIWSLLKINNVKVQAQATFALCPCIQNVKDSGELVRSLVGGMELLISKLKSKDIPLLSAACAAIAIIAKDEANLAILTDLKVIYKLSKLVNTSDDLLREHLGAAIASCAHYGTNTQDLGRLGVITPLGLYMGSNSPLVHRTAAMALEKLSVDPQNCATMHQSGIVPFLLDAVSSKDKILQLAAAGCLRNIRILALRAEEYLMKIDQMKF